MSFCPGNKSVGDPGEAHVTGVYRGALRDSAAQDRWGKARGGRGREGSGLDSGLELLRLDESIGCQFWFYFASVVFILRCSFLSPSHEFSHYLFLSISLSSFLSSFPFFNFFFISCSLLLSFDHRLPSFLIFLATLLSHESKRK